MTFWPWPDKASAKTSLAVSLTENKQKRFLTAPFFVGWLSSSKVVMVSALSKYVVKLTTF
jgi:hypothetical protein